MIARRTVNIGREPWRPDNNYPFSYRLPFDQPFVLHGGAVGLFELRLLDTTLCRNLVHPDLGDVDYYTPSFPPGWTPPPPVVVGQTCAPIGYTTSPQVLYCSGVIAGWTMARVRWNPMSGMRPGAISMLFAGLDNARWAGASLPLALDSLGAPGCSIFTSFDWQLDTISDTPFTEAVLAVPDLPQVAGTNLWVQGIRLHPAFNALGAITTNAVGLTVMRFASVSMSWSDWGTMSSLSPGTSNYTVAGGPVMLLDGR
ncbi:MAG: hypothetical protein U1F36_09320 [Planctomycetota bacterium]